MAKKEITIQKLDIPQDQLDEYKDAFDMYDRDKSGDISAKELASLFRSLGHKMSDSEIKDMIDAIDTSGDGSISFDEFIYLMQKIEIMENENKPKVEEIIIKIEPKIVEEDDEIIKAFKVFDTDNSGTLNKIELRHILTRIGDKFSDEEVDDIFKAADMDGNGEIDYKEFVQYWRMNFF